MLSLSEAGLTDDRLALALSTLPPNRWSLGMRGEEREREGENEKLSE